ncbi:hypothetical protein LC065_06210 [Halobacillus litoralis]|uniref:hypothetical protein n=1 Tax=Halobacillus litoralis TaxID=45668 RepID=UPI00273E5CDF|nr:hypothetical protein [Halobacillus litoralis]WLR48772.1 hypothetical protein LC065_06210 [Halobacillus litoralis]
MNRTKAPFIQPELVKNSHYRRIVFTSYIGFTLHFAVLFLMPIMLEQVYGRGAAAIGFIIFPWGYAISRSRDLRRTPD